MRVGIVRASSGTAARSPCRRNHPQRESVREQRCVGGRHEAAAMMLPTWRNCYLAPGGPITAGWGGRQSRNVRLLSWNGCSRGLRQFWNVEELGDRWSEVLCHRVVGLQQLLDGRADHGAEGPLPRRRLHKADQDLRDRLAA